jgi:hypothetical protein
MRYRAILRYGILFLFFILTLQPPVDFDIGWHLRYGEYFFQTGHVLKDNILSYIWPQYHWVQASWGYDVLLYALYHLAGFSGIMVTGAVITFAIFGVIVYPFKRFTFLQLLFMSLIFFSQGILLYSGSLRSQTPSTLFFAITLVFFYKNIETFSIKKIAILPLLFLIWANMHGGFALGLILLFVMWSMYGILLWYKKLERVRWQQWRWLGVSLFTSILTPLLNPWGRHIYDETFKHASNTNLTAITEWQPLTQAPIETVIGCIILGIVAYIALRRKQIADIPYLIAITIVTYLAFSAVRFLMLLDVMIVFYLANTLPHLHVPKFPAVVRATGTTVLLIFFTYDLLFFHIYFRPPSSHLFSFNWKTYCHVLENCSEEITLYMKDHPPTGNGFHPYNYGGYLSWRLPEVKTFIDGRMSAWEENGHTPPLMQSLQALNQPIMFRELDNTYHFRWAIVPTSSVLFTYFETLAKSNMWKLERLDHNYAYYIKL